MPADHQPSNTLKPEAYEVFIDLDKTLLPYDTVGHVWKAIVSAGLRPSPFGMNLKFGLASVAKSLMASSFAGRSQNEYEVFLSDLADRFVKDIDFSVKSWAEDLVSDKSHIHILTGSFSPLASRVAHHLAWGRSMGTEVEIISGRLTGYLASPALKARHKLEAIERNFDLKHRDFKQLAAAGDSYGDRFLMERCSWRYFPKNSSRRLIRYFEAK